MQEKLSLDKKEEALWEILCNPVDFSQFFIPANINNPADWSPGGEKLIMRFYQISAVAWDFLSGNRDMDFLKQVGDGVWLGGRTTGKSLFSITADELQDIVISNGKQSLITALDNIHLKDRMREIEDYMYLHSFFKHFRRGINKTPSWVIEAKNGHITWGVIEGTNKKGTNYQGKHVHRLKTEETQLLTREGFEQLADAKSEEGRVERHIGVPDGRRTTPFHDMITGDEYKRNRFAIPSWVSPYWDEKREKEAVKKYKGRNTPGYVHNVEAEEGEVAFGTWDMKDVMSAVRESRDAKILNITKDLLKKYAINELLPLPILPEGSQEVIIGADAGLENPTVIIPFVKYKDLWHYVCRVNLVRVIYEKQAEIIDYIMNFYTRGRGDSGVKCFAIDDTYGDGKAIVQILQNPENEQYRDKGYEERVVGVGFNETILVGYEKDAEGKVKVDTKGKPIPIMEKVKFKSTAELQTMFSNGEFLLPSDEEMVAEFNAEVTQEGKSERVYTSSYTRHILTAFRIFAIAKFMKYGLPYIEDINSVDLENYFNVGSWMGSLEVR